jgi:hypothetical protein
MWIIMWVSKWLLFYANSSIFQLYHGEPAQDNFEWDDDEIRFVLDQHAELVFFHSSSSLKQQSAGKAVAPLGHIIIIPSKPVLVFPP